MVNSDNDVEQSLHVSVWFSVENEAINFHVIEN